MLNVVEGLAIKGLQFRATQTTIPDQWVVELTGGF